MSKAKVKRKIRQAAAAIAALALAVSFTFPAGTEIMGFRLGNAIVASALGGTYGEVDWTLDDNGTLTISGGGFMHDSGSPEAVPWFGSRENIKSVVIYDGVRSIGNYACWDCTSLISITIPDSVRYIGKSAFFECTSLTSIAIPNSVTSIGDDSFTRCTSLTSISVDENNPYYCSVDGVLFNKDKTTLVAYPNGKGASYVIPNGVSSIGAYAFNGCSSLTSITIPDGVTSIGKLAFYCCTNLTSITIPNDVSSIGAYAFYGCSSLTSIFLPVNLDVSSAYIPDAATQIKYTVTDGKVTVTGVTLGDGQTSFTIPSTIDGKDVTVVYIENGTTVTAPDTATQIKYTVSANEVTITEIKLGTGQTSVDIPSTIGGKAVTYIADGALETCPDVPHTHRETTAATCTEKAVCGICVQEYGDALGHDNSGEWQTNDDEHWKVCARNGCNEAIDRSAHISNGGIITVQPTATSKGVKTYSCTICEKVLKTEEVSASGNRGTSIPSRPSTSAPSVFSEKITVKTETSGSKTTLKWDEIDNADSYIVYQYKDGKYVKVKTTTDTSVTFKNLKNGETYKFLVRYTISGRLSPTAYSRKFTVKVYYKPIVKATSTANSVKLSWNAVPEAEKYAVYKYVNGKAVKLCETNKLAVKITKLKPDTEYKYIVRAYIDGEWTAMKKSDIVTIATKAE